MIHFKFMGDDSLHRGAKSVAEYDAFSNPDPKGFKFGFLSVDFLAGGYSRVVFDSTKDLEELMDMPRGTYDELEEMEVGESRLIHEDYIAHFYIRLW